MGAKIARNLGIVRREIQDTAQTCQSDQYPISRKLRFGAFGGSIKQLVHHDHRGVVEVSRLTRCIGRGAVANYIYAADVAEAGIELAARRDAAGDVFIASDPCAMDEFIQMMAEALGAGIPAGRLPGPVILGAARVFELAGRLARVQPPLTVGRVRALTTRRLYSPARLRGFGIVPRVGLHEGLRRTVAWYREQGLLA